MNTGAKILLGCGIGALVWQFLRTAGSFLKFDFKVAGVSNIHLDGVFLYFDLDFGITNYSDQAVTLNNIDMILSINGVRAGMVYNDINADLPKYGYKVVPFKIRADIQDSLSIISDYLSDSNKKITLGLEGSLKANWLNYPISLNTQI